MGVSFVVSAYLQVVRGYNAIQTGVIFTAATLGILGASLVAAPLVRRFQQRLLILTGFVASIIGIAVLLAVVKHSPSPWAFAPGLLIIGLGVGVMLTPSVNVVQSAFPEAQQGEISGLSRCVSNLGSSLGTAVAGTILVSGLTSPQHSYALAMIALIVFSAIGAVVALGIPKQRRVAPGRSPAPAPAPTPAPTI
jgi:MFS family permease